jgi:hypothetical protein
VSLDTWKDPLTEATRISRVYLWHPDPDHNWEIDPEGFLYITLLKLYQRPDQFIDTCKYYEQIKGVPITRISLATKGGDPVD